MIKAIINKEWYKTRLAFFVTLAVSLLFSAYAALRINRLIALKGVDHLWLIVLLKDNTFADMIQMLPLLTGLVLGVAQMAPEMSHKRLKLTMHLPVPQTKLLMLMLAVGVAEALVVFAGQAAVIGIYDLTVMPAPMVASIMLTTLPWFVAGLAAYLFACAICLEASWRRRVGLGLLAAAMLAMFYSQPALEAYNSFLPILLIATASLAILSAGSMIRFKEGLSE